MSRYEFVIPEYFLCALINDDLTGLDSEEVSQFNHWFNCAKRSLSNVDGHWTQENTQARFCKPDYLGKSGMCVDVIFVVID